MLKTLILETSLFQKTEIVIDHLTAIQLYKDQHVVSFYLLGNMNFNVPFESEEDTIKAYEEASRAIQGKI